MTSTSIEGTDLEVVAYVNGGGTLVLRVNKAGVCVADVGILHATDAIGEGRLIEIGASTRPVLRDLRRAAFVDLLAEDCQSKRRG